MKLQLSAMFAAGAMLPALFAAETTPVPFGTIPLNGGRIEPVRMTMIESSPEHLNFCFAHQFEDGSIYLSHSAGVHTVTEYGCRDHSLDGGKTWQRTDPDFGGASVSMSPAEKLMQTRTITDGEGRELFKVNGFGRL